MSEGTTLDRATALRVVGMVLFALAVAGALMADEAVAWLRPFDGSLSSGDAAVSVLLICAGWSMTALFITARGVRVSLLFASLARYVGVSVGMLIAFFIALKVAGIFDEATARALWVGETDRRAVLGFLWDQGTAAPQIFTPATAPAAYFAVELQLVTLIWLAVLAVGRRPLLFAGVAVAMSGLCLWAEVTVLDDRLVATMPFEVWSHADGFFLGAAAAAVAQRLRPRPGLDGAALLVVAGAALAPSFLTIEETMRWVTPAVVVCALLFLVAGRPDPSSGSLAERFVESPEVLAAGTAWRSVVLWSGPVVVLICEHASSAPTTVRLAFSAIGLAVVATASESVRQRTESAWAELQGHVRTWRNTRSGASVSGE